jgi:ABC-2 type transport system ATP-binding protein
VHGRSAEEIGELAATRGVALHELVTREASLEEAFMRLTGEAVEYHASTVTPTLLPELEHAA